jgi:plasmid stabilization system protein ParE
MKVQWTETAFQGLASIREYLADAEDFATAERLVSSLIERGESLGRLPERGRRVPELPESDLRELVASNYRMVYRIRDNKVQILSVFEGHRRFPADSLRDA